MITPSTQALVDQYLATLEGSLAQKSPLQSKAFLRVLSVALALGTTGLYKLAAERARQNLVLTATGEDLDLLGDEAGVPRKLAESAALSVTLVAPDGVTIPPTTTFVGDLNGLLYTISAGAVAAGGAASFTVVCNEPGSEGNLQADDTLTIVSPVPGAGSVAAVTAVTNTGADIETDEEYRPRVLFAERSTKGGGNPTNYKTWGEGVAGVARCFPYAGKPAGSVTASYPGDRTVYVQAADTADGIPTNGLLAEVRSALNKDPDTGLTRAALGLIDSTLYVEPITRTSVAVNIAGLAAPAGTEADVRTALEAALTLYFLQFSPYIDGVDLPQDRNDRITTPGLSTALQEVLESTGSSASGVSFSVAGVTLGSYQLGAGELAKRGAVTYVG